MPKSALQTNRNIRKVCMTGQPKNLTSKLVNASWFTCQAKFKGKLARPFHGPFRVLSLTPTNAEVRLVDEPKSQSIFVSLNRVRKCYEELPDQSWRGSTPRKYAQIASDQQHRTTPQVVPDSYTGPMTRSRTASAGN